ncbi:MAG: DUF4198 domain-containing protein [Desulfovibrio sp.]|jgi:cobalt/nickel transport protein|nr:DUF4198 domain-containing protein [Desulfovibrio sp.]
MRLFFSFVLLSSLLCPAGQALAHFGMVLPSQSLIMDVGTANLTLDLKFWHPFVNEGMDLEKPAAFTVYHNGKTKNLLPGLKEGSEQGKRVWQGNYAVKEPGLYAFVMEPRPYFEKEEDRWILHYTKVYAQAFGDDADWFEPLGIKAEIVPLTPPGDLYAGNIFQGRVLIDGKTVPEAEVEIEWYPGRDKKGQAPFASLITQTVRADASGTFSFVAPRSGWWGFAALSHDGKTLPLDGKEKPVEIGGVLWVFFHELLPALPLAGK